MNVLLSSVGRRPYLVEWFKEAQINTGHGGLVVTADADPNAPSRTVGDAFVLAPPARDESYTDWLTATLKEHDIQLAVSVNDFELSRWAHLPETAEYASLVRLRPDVQTTVEDKLTLQQVMTGVGVQVPQTWLLADVLAEPSLLGDTEELVLKGRFGSASRGLRFTNQDELVERARGATAEVTTAEGRPARDFEEAVQLMVVQPQILGQEYGIDVVSDFERNFVATLARKKLSMRFGETDQAMSADPGPFNTIAETIARAIPHRGLIDTDVLVDDEGTAWLIDVNPRFGGGYPFSHMAGADIPTSYLQFAAGADPGDSVRYQTGVTSAKYVDILRTGELP